MPGEGGSIDSAEFRTVLGHFASGVTIVAGHGAEGPVGLTCQSFFGASLEPPLVLISVDRAPEAGGALLAVHRHAQASSKEANERLRQTER